MEACRLIPNPSIARTKGLGAMAFSYPEFVLFRVYDPLQSTQFRILGYKQTSCLQPNACHIEDQARSLCRPPPRLETLRLRDIKSQWCWGLVQRLSRPSC